MMLTLQGSMLLYFLTFLIQKARGTEIIHGKKVPDKLMLYMASVQKDGVHICGGFLISEDFVVTAAHCVKNPISVVLGTHNLKKIDDNTMRYNVTMCKYGNFVNVKSGNDIVLLKLSKKVKLNKKVQPIQIPKAEMKLKDKAKCRVAGWGFKKPSGKVSDVLEVAEVSLMNLEQCKKRWAFLNLSLPDNVICTNGNKAKTGFCKGDSGGPLVCGGVAMGITSFNRDCDTNVPNVYTDVSKYASWLNNKVQQKQC